MDKVGVCTGGGGAGVCGGESRLETEDSLMGLGGGVLEFFACFSAGGFGGANDGWSGTVEDGGLEMGIEDTELLEEVDGGFGGAIGGGFKKVKSSSRKDGASEGGLGAGMDGG